MTTASRILTGFTDLDTLLEGLRPGITTLASRSSMGKSILVYTILEFAARAGLRNDTESPAHTLLFSSGLDWKGVSNYLVAIKTGIPRRIIERGTGTEEHRSQIAAALATMEASNTIFFLPNVEWDIVSLHRAVEEKRSLNKVDFLVLDGPAAGDFKRNPELMNELEDIATTHALPILVTHDLDSLYLDQREDKRPTVFDLNDTPLLAQKSNVILFLYRDVFYNRETETPHGAEIIVAKNDYGDTGTINIRFMPEISRFENAAVAD